jgi:hypothetical protein
MAMVPSTQKRKIPHKIDSEFRSKKIDLKLNTTPMVTI